MSAILDLYPSSWIPQIMLHYWTMQSHGHGLPAILDDSSSLAMQPGVCHLVWSDPVV